jgi:hypothetical protein
LQALQQAGSARNRLITVLCDEPASLQQIAVVAARFASRKPAFAPFTEAAQY